MKHITFIVSCLIFMGLFTTYELSSQNIVYEYEPDVFVKVFRLNNKKEISKKELEKGLVFCCEVDRDNLDRIEILSLENSPISVVIENTDTKEVKLKIDKFDLREYNNEVSFYVFPWVSCSNSLGRNTVKIFSGNNIVSQFEFSFYRTCD